MPASLRPTLTAETDRGRGQRRMLRRVISMLLIGLLTTTGCTVTFEGHAGGDETPHPTAPTDEDGVEVWDLRTPPSASDVGLRDKDYVGYDTKEPRMVRILLPEDKVLETKVYLVTFDRVVRKDPEDPTRPTGMDVHAGPMPLDVACTMMGRSLTAFGLDTSAVDTWRAKIEGRATDGPSAHLRIEGGGNTEIGYLNIGVGGVYQPLDGDSSVSLAYHANFY